MEILHFSHPHKLSFVEVSKETDPVFCHGCGRFFQGPAFTCKKCPDFFLHKSCGELPRQIQNHAFHPQHPLKLCAADSFICDGCGEIQTSFVYRCGICMFSLDARCATLNQELATSMAPKGKEIKVKINHFSHIHPLTRGIGRRLSKLELRCMACKQDAAGKLNYACLYCFFIIHESCANNMPEQVKSSFHPEHTLVAQPIRNYLVHCFCCGDIILGIGFSCGECGINFHVSCAKYETRAVKHNFHVHPLLLLGKSNIGFSYGIWCDECGESCKESFLSCKNCEFDIHLECVPLPSIVKHVRHLHFLNLVNSVVEDDSGEYYCDMCETERNSELSVYSCEECKFVAHIDSVISEVEPPERVSEYLIPRPRNEEADEGNQITGKMDGKLWEGKKKEKTQENSSDVYVG
ncbi:hypothetical protein PTKIN_Ptkin01aG0353000 [Pterospermum kingtungense]